MYSDEQKEQIIKLLNKCKGLIGSEPTVYNEGDRYGIEFEGYQTLSIKVESVFDMSDDEVNALVNLMAHALPMAYTLFEEINRNEAKIETLMDAIATISLVASEKIKRISKIEIIEEDVRDSPTVGEK